MVRHSHPQIGSGQSLIMNSNNPPQGVNRGIPITPPGDVFVEVILPKPGDNSYAFYQLIQNLPNNDLVANPDFRSFIDFSVGINKLVATGAVDIRVFTATPPPATGVAVAYHRVKTDPIPGRIQLFLNPATITDFDLCQVTYSKAADTDASNPNGVWNSPYDMVFIFEDDSTTSFTDQTGKGNNGTSTSGATLVNGLRDLKAYKNNGQGTAAISVPSPSFNFAAKFTVGVFLKIDNPIGSVVELWGKKLTQNGSHVGIQLFLDDRAGIEGVELRTNDGTNTNDSINLIPGAQIIDLLEDGNFHYITCSIDSSVSPHTFEMSVDGRRFGSGDLALTGSFVNTQPFSMFRNVAGGSTINCTIQNLSITDNLRNAQDILATTRNMINYDAVIGNTKQDLSAVDGTRFLLAKDTPTSGEVIQATNLLPAWDFRGTITVPHIKVEGEAPMPGYTVYVDITDSKIKDVSQADGDDLRFLNTAGVPLNFAIEKIDTTLVGRIQAHVQIDLDGGNDTSFFLFIGNNAANTGQTPASTWAQNQASWLMNETAGSITSIKDLGPNNLVTTFATAATPVAGLVDGAINLATTSFGAVATNTALGVTNALTFECVIKKNGVSNDAIYSRGVAGFADAWAVVFNGTGILGGFLINDGAITSTQFVGGAGPTISDNNFHYIAVTYDGTTLIIYVDGIPAHSTVAPGNIVDPGSNVSQIGASTPSGSDPMKGIIDNVKQSNVTRSADFIKTYNDNIVNPTTFIEFGGFVNN